MTRPARCLSAALPALLLLFGLLVPGPGRALDFKLIGGPGYLFWHSSVEGQASRFTGYAHGISGVGFFQFGDHLRISSGMLHGTKTFDDHSVIDRHFFFAGLRGVLPLYSKIYLTGGVDVGEGGRNPSLVTWGIRRIPPRHRRLRCAASAGLIHR